jgi:hypothetical protein
MENLQRLTCYLLILTITLASCDSYRYICANRLCLCKVVNDGKSIRADCTKSPQLDHVPIEEFSAMEYSMLSFVDMTGTHYCHSRTPPTHDVAAHIVCKRISNSEMQNPGLGTFNLGHYDTVVSHPSTTTVVVSTVSVLLLVIISTGAGIWIYKVRYC